MKTLITLILLLVSGCLLAQQPEQIRRIDQLAAQYVSAPANHALVIGIIQHGRRKVLLYGETQKGNGTAPGPYSIFEVGELSGLFTASVLAQMAMAGEVSLDTPAQDLMPPGQRLPVYLRLQCKPFRPENEGTLFACEPNFNDETIPILLCDLATHTAGLPRNPRNLQAWRNPKNPYARYGQKQLYQFLNNYPIQFTGALDYRYSHTGLALLGDILARRDSATFEDLLGKRLLEPLGMEDTRLHLTENQQSRLLTGHTRKGRKTPLWETEALAPALGMRSTPTDMMNFLAANLGASYGDWTYISALAQTPRVSIHSRSLAGSRAGLGWLLSPLPEVPEEVIWQAGTTGGFASYIGLLRQSGIGVVILSNSANPVDQLGKEIIRLLYDDLPPVRTVMLPGRP
jgi:serine-type D-Ala-D-Ala carboxypeptidase/endopeptidase